MAEATLQTAYTPAQVVERGKAIYEQQIRAEVEMQENIGKLLMVDILSGDWVMGEDRIEMARRARDKRPDAVLYGLRIGYVATEKIGLWPRRKGRQEPE